MQFLNSATGNMSMPYPNFLCIGAQKAGTTWLSHNLSQHPDIWIPPLKELHYFDAQARTPLILHLGRKSRSGIQAQKGLKLLRHAPLWGCRYLLQFRTARTYHGLFQPSPGQICGEATPAYARQQEPVIAQVKATLPDVKIIYLLRDPVERVWSQVKMASMKVASAQKSRAKKIYPAEQEMLDLLQHRWDKIAEHSDYYGNLTRWQRYFPSENIFVGFFDQLESNPKQLFQSILQFLNVRSDEAVIPADVATARNQRPPRPMPSSTRRMITARLLPQIELLHEHFDNGYTATWLQNARATLHDA